MASIELSDFKSPFFCGWKKRLEPAGADTYDSDCFGLLADAEAEFKNLLQDKTLYVYLGEIGIFDKSGVFVDWITFQTNDRALWEKFGVEETNPRRNTRGYGLPESVEGLKSPYAVYYKIISPRKP